MKHLKTSAKRSMFDVLVRSKSAQAAMMTLRPGKSSSDEPAEEHPRAEQWLFVVSGTGRATDGRRHVRLSAGSLLLIEKRERHQITNTGRSNLVTLNLYVPPAYDDGGEVMEAVKNASKRSE